MTLWWVGNVLLALALAGCVAVIAVQLWRTSLALARVDAGLAGLPPALSGVEPTVDAINGSLRRVAEATVDRVPVS